MLVLFVKRRNRHLTQQEVALSLKPRVSQGLVSQWEQGFVKPKPGHLEQLAKMFGVSSPDDLLLDYEEFVKLRYGS